MFSSLILLSVFSTLLLSATAEENNTLTTCSVLDNNTDLLNCSLRGFTEVPQSWGDRNYIGIDLSRNSISLVTQFPYSNIIQQLFLRHNNISELNDKSFAKLVNLKVLDLSYNYITYTALTSLVFRGEDDPDDYEPIGVEILWLSNNELHSLDAKVFEHLPNLTELYLDHNPFNSLDQVTVLGITSAWRSLRMLDLSYTELEDLPEGFLHTLQRLEALNLAGNQFTTVPATLVEATATLRSLTFSDNPLEVFEMPTMRALEDLEVNQVDTLMALKKGALANLPLLSAFRCNYNCHLTEIEEGIFGEPTNLTTLELRHNALTTLDPIQGLPLERMRVFDLRDNPWNCDCRIAWLAQVLNSELSAAANPNQQSTVRCASPGTVKEVALVKLPLPACKEATSITQRLTVLMGLLAVIAVAVVVVYTAKWARRHRQHPPLPRLSPADFEDGEDVVHYVRLANKKEGTEEE